MPLFAAAVLVFGLRLARRFRRPARFRAGVITIALAVVTFWPLQLVAAGVELGYREYNVFLHGLAFFISVCLFTGGIEAMRRASNTPQADLWSSLIEPAVPGSRMPPPAGGPKLNDPPPSSSEMEVSPRTSWF